MQEKFAVIEDPRQQGYVKHKLCDILTMVMCAIICGLDELGTVVTYIGNRAVFFKENFGIASVPSKATFSRVLRMIDGEKVAKIMVNIMKEQLGEQGDVLAVDGKAVRGTGKDGDPNTNLQIITAYLTESGVVLGQEKIHEKTNEIPVFQEMLDNLNVKGKTVTADAMHCQKETCRKIVEREGDYLFGLKGNQGTLHDDVKLFFESTPSGFDIETFATLEKNGGRLEYRRCRKLAQLDWLAQKDEWPGLKTVFAIDRRVTTKKGISEETCYYISSSDFSAQKLMEIAREHWKVESMHWMLDVVFSEDFSAFSSEETHLTLNAFRKYALALHRAYLASIPKKCAVKTNMLNCLLHDSLLLRVIASG